MQIYNKILFKQWTFNSLEADSSFVWWDLKYSSYWLEENLLLVIVAILISCRLDVSNLGFCIESEDCLGVAGPWLFILWTILGFDLDRDLIKLNLILLCLGGLEGGSDFAIKEGFCSCTRENPNSLSAFGLDEIGGGSERFSLGNLFSIFLKRTNNRLII